MNLAISVSAPDAIPARRLDSSAGEHSDALLFRAQRVAESVLGKPEWGIGRRGRSLGQHGVQRFLGLIVRTYRQDADLFRHAAAAVIRPDQANVEAAVFGGAPFAPDEQPVSAGGQLGREVGSVPAGSVAGIRDLRFVAEHPALRASSSAANGAPPKTAGSTLAWSRRMTAAAP